MQNKTTLRNLLISLLYSSFAIVSSVATAQHDKEENSSSNSPLITKNITIDNASSDHPIDHVAVILPTYNPSIKIVSNAIYQGVVSTKTLEKNIWLPISFYELRESNTDELIKTYRDALSAGAKTVIGPLTHKAVNALSQSQLKFVPTICLNISRTWPTTNQNLYAFGLQIQNEAKELAQLAYSEGGQQVMTIFEHSPLNNRVMQAFNEEWLDLSGEIAEQVYIEDNKINFEKIVQLLDNTQADTIFIAVSPKTAQNLRPYLGTRLPIYTTSLVHISNTDKLRMHDLEDIRFLEMPWIINHTSKIGQNWGDDSLRLLRFYALGKDAYTLAKEVSQGHPENLWIYKGASGELTHSNQIFFRKGQPVKFTRGGIKRLQINTLNKD